MMMMMRMDTWIVLVCAFDFSVVIFQYCTSGFSSGQGPGGLARRKERKECSVVRKDVKNDMHRKTAFWPGNELPVDATAAVMVACLKHEDVETAWDPQCACRISMSNIPEYPQLWPRQGAVSRLVHANRARRGTAAHWSKVIEIYHVGIVFRGFSRWFEIFRNAVPDTAIAAWLNDCKFDANVPNAASHCCSCLSACWSLFWSWCPNTMRCLSLTQTGFPVKNKGIQSAELLTSQFQAFSLTLNVLTKRCSSQIIPAKCQCDWGSCCCIASGHRNPRELLQVVMPSLSLHV